MTKHLLLCLSALLLATALGAQVEVPPGSVLADLGTCDASREGLLRKVSDGDSVNDCNPSGTGDETVLCQCNEASPGSYAWLAMEAGPHDGTGTDDQNANEVPFTPDDGAEWTDPDPTEVDAALENLAPRVVANDAKVSLDLIDDGDAQSSTASSESGLELITGELGLIRGCINGQVLKWDETNGDWDCSADSTGGSPTFDAIASGTNTTATMTVGSGAVIEIEEGGDVGATEVIVFGQNETGATLFKCTTVHLNSFDAPSALPKIVIADSDDSSLMPAIGVTFEDIATGTSGRVLIAGLLATADTTSANGGTWAEGDRLYVDDSGTSVSDECGDNLTKTRPANTDDGIQAIATVVRAHATLGKLAVLGAGRENDIPNIVDGSFWVGNATNVGTAVAMSGDATMANTGAVTIATGAVDVAMLANGTDGELITWSAAGVAATVAVGTATHVLTSNGVGVAPTFQAAAGGGAMPPKEYYWPAAALLALEHAADSVAPLLKEEGTNVDMLVRAFDDTADECVGGTFAVPTDLGTGSVTFRIRWYSATATTNDAMFDFRWIEVGDNESWDQALTTEEAGAVTTAGTVDLITLDTWTETLGTLTWAANDVIEFELCRDANSTGTGTDNLVGDAYVIDFAVEIPRA